MVARISEIFFYKEQRIRKVNFFYKESKSNKKKRKKNSGRWEGRGEGRGWGVARVSDFFSF